MTKKFQKLIEANEKKFIKEAARRWNEHRICALRGGTGYSLYIYAKYYKTNPNKGDHLMAISTSLCHMPSPLYEAFRSIWSSETYKVKYEETIETLEELYTLYKKRIIARYKKGDLKLKYPQKPTSVLDELLKREFILASDVLTDKKKVYFIRVIIPFNGGVDMVWPKPFEDSDEAKKIAKRFAIGKYKIIQIK